MCRNAWLTKPMRITLQLQNKTTKSLSDLLQRHIHKTGEIRKYSNMSRCCPYHYVDSSWYCTQYDTCGIRKETSEYRQIKDRQRVYLSHFFQLQSICAHSHTLILSTPEGWQITVSVLSPHWKWNQNHKYFMDPRGEIGSCYSWSF